MRLVAGVASTSVLVLATVVLVHAFQARDRFELKPWHLVVPSGELVAADVGRGTTLAEVLVHEETVFRQVRERVMTAVPPGDREAWNRYWPEGPLCPSNLPRDENRTFELVPEKVRGGVLLVHGLTDSPYSMRRLATIYRDLGYHALALRMPGHGTVPAALVEADWEDWAAAVRVGARHVRERAGPGTPFHLVGYSNGGALVLDYALDLVDGADLPRPDRLVLVSPMVGVSPLAGFARLLSALGVLPPFAASRWLDVTPEFNPWKYGSFPAHAAAETFALTSRLAARLRRAQASGAIRALPPTLTFVSLADATVRTAATVRVLHDRLGSNGNELVVFDLNRSSRVRPFLRREDLGLLEDLLPRRVRPYGVSVVTNADPATRDVVETRTPPGTEESVTRPLGLAWPVDVYSLSHVALPFPPDDPLYGGRPEPAAGVAVNLGTLDPRGEKSVLTVPADQLMRLTWNPFFPYLEERLRQWAAPGTLGGIPPGR